MIALRGAAALPAFASPARAVGSVTLSGIQQRVHASPRRARSWQ